MRADEPDNTGRVQRGAADDGDDRSTYGGSAAERRLVTILFADVAGFTALAETLDPEEVRDLLNRLFDRLVPCVEDYGGTVDKFMGDCLMAVFGTPLAHDNDAERAVRAAIRIRQALRSIKDDDQLPLSVHLGINTGRVVAGEVGGGGHHQYSVIGDAVNVAKRLEELSAGDEILLGPDTHRLVRDVFRATEAGSLTVRGRSGAITVYRLDDEQPARRSSPRTTRLTSTLVGREAEAAAFRRQRARLEKGEGGALFVLGEAGLGKSRLVAEMRQEAGAEGVSWLEGRASSFGGRVSYLPFRAILETDAGISLEDPPGVRAGKLSARVRELVGEEAEETERMLAALLNLRAPEHPGGAGTEPRTDDVLRDRLFEGVVQYLRARAAKRPLGVVFEDAQWLEPSSEALVRHLLPLCRDTPILFVLVGRRGGDALEALREHAGRLLGDRVSELVLQPLPPEKSRMVLRNLLGPELPPAELLAATEARAEGNPLFLEEIAHHLVERGAFIKDPKAGWRAGPSAADTPMPDSLQGLVAARIDNLPEAAKTHLRYASVIGRSFPRRILAALVPGSEAAVDRSLEELEELDLIQRRMDRGDAMYSFRHALVQETAYESILLKERRRLHLEAAQAIERSLPERLDDLWGLLAFHYSRAEEWGRAQECLLQAGEQSVLVAGDTEALGYYQEAMATLLRAFDGTWAMDGAEDPVTWFLERSDPFWQTRQLGSLLPSAQTFHQTVRAACGPGDARTWAAAAILGAAYLQRAMFDEAAELLDEAIASGAERADGREGPLSRLLLLLGVVRINQDRPEEAEELLRRAVSTERARANPDGTTLLDAYLFLCTAHYYSGHIGQDRRVIEEALAEPDLDRSARYWELLINLSSCQLTDGDWDNAAESARRCLEEAPNPYVRAHAGSHLGAVRHAQGWYREAECLFRQALADFERLGRRTDVGEVLQDLAETQLREGRLGAAEESATRALELLQAAYGRGASLTARAHWTLAGVALARGRPSEADEYLREAEAIARERMGELGPFQSELYFRRACVHREQGRIDQAQEDLDQAQAILVAIGGKGHPRIGGMLEEWEARPRGRS